MSGSLGDVTIHSQQDSEPAQSDLTTAPSPLPAEGAAPDAGQEERAPQDRGDVAGADVGATGTSTPSTKPADVQTPTVDHTDASVCAEGSETETDKERDSSSSGLHVWNDGLIARRAGPDGTGGETDAIEEGKSESTGEADRAHEEVEQPSSPGGQLVDGAVFDALPSRAAPRPTPSTTAHPAHPAHDFPGYTHTEAAPTAAGTGTGSFPTHVTSRTPTKPEHTGPSDTSGGSTQAGSREELAPSGEPVTEAPAPGPVGQPVPEATVTTRPRTRPVSPHTVPSSTPGGERGLGRRLVALRELVGLSRTRLEPATLADAVQVLEEAAARGRLSRAHTTVALAGSTGCGKSTLFNALAGAQLSEAGVRRPTTSAPVACVWEANERVGGADGLLERLGVPPRSRRRAHLRDSGHRGLGGLVLLDLPDHDSVADRHREQVDRVLRLVDAVIWVVDPEKYADAVLHERYLRPLAGHAEITYVVLNQTDRLPAEATGELLDDLRRLLDEDGVALGEHGDPGAQVLSLSALTGDGVGELRDALRELVRERSAAARRLAADVGSVVEGLRPACVGQDDERPEGLTAPVRENFEERLGVAVGAAAVGHRAERLWLRQADLACGTAWAGLARLQARRAAAKRGERPGGWAVNDRPRTGTAVPTKGVELSTVRSDTGKEADQPETGMAGHAVVEQAVQGLADDATRGLPKEWARSARSAALRGGQGLPAALDHALASARLPARPTRPTWWTVAAAGQALLLGLQLIGICWLVGGILAGGMGFERWFPFGLLVGGAVGAPLLAWTCRAAARGPARAFGLEQEQRLRRLAADAGRARVLEPVAAELLRYTEVREQYVIAAAGPRQT